MNDTCVKFLKVVKAPPSEFNRCITPSMSTGDIAEHYETLKRSVYKRGDLIDRESLDQLLNNIELQHGSAIDMLQRMREIIGLFKQRFLFKLPQQVQAVLVSFQNIASDKLAAFAEALTLKEKPQTTQNDITELCRTLTATVAGEHSHLLYIKDVALPGRYWCTS
ncbi:unnamed protein product [Schistosoma margrebowiei]|uniref:Uncharacterized protein n=1 Tax=Schistosoma margrebowiei TaxID=48269 RepID=A0A183N9E8_9TREM|nr:unnamed protein product [Schistosoma margrebowiei]